MKQFIWVFKFNNVSGFLWGWWVKVKQHVNAKGSFFSTDSSHFRLLSCLILAKKTVRSFISFVWKKTQVKNTVWWFMISLPVNIRKQLFLTGSYISFILIIWSICIYIYIHTHFLRMISPHIIEQWHLLIWYPPDINPQILIPEISNHIFPKYPLTYPPKYLESYCPRKAGTPLSKVLLAIWHHFLEFQWLRCSFRRQGVLGVAVGTTWSCGSKQEDRTGDARKS